MLTGTNSSQSRTSFLLRPTEAVCTTRDRLLFQSTRKHTFSAPLFCFVLLPNPPNVTICDHLITRYFSDPCVFYSLRVSATWVRVLTPET
ncbi:unnamed protein product [Protopolystoma xenopodis]|uniref:Uncharacterized protein n=1 Tax=Protopolystoma xenopodis TaxID=117903 RepID=A0A3S4ZZ25_9PLAT|nr:unnamed protein product [Protopolystoma xenopodis]